MIKDLSDIDRSTDEGALLFAALVKLTGESQNGRTPSEVIDQLNRLSDELQKAYRYTPST